MTPDLLEAATARLPEMLDDLRTLVSCESPTSDPAAVAAGAAEADALGQRLLEMPAERIVLDGLTHLRWRLGNPTGPRVLLVCHQDTVWPAGTLARLPFRVTDGIAYGPGCFDMKTGVVMAFHALALLGAPGVLPAVTLLVTGDEEIGSPTSRTLIEDEARIATAAFVLEASADAALKTGRKGVSLFTVTAIGRASHAGLEPELGLNAAVEISGQVLAVNGLGDAEAGTSVVPTVMSAGTTTNTVPATATVKVDSRAWTVAEQQRVADAMTALRPTVDGARVEVTGGINRPPMEPAGGQVLFALAEQLSEQIGSGPLQQISVGGGSDGNFTAGVGCPTLDGLGAVGGGAHAETEHVVVAQIPNRTALLAALIDAVCGGAAVR